MEIKLNDVKRPTGIPSARAAVAGEEDNAGVLRIVLFMSAEDAHGIPTAVASLRLTPDEALALGERLLVEADRARRVVRR